MKISLIGAMGNAGSRILAELSRRGHQVMAIVRQPERVPKLYNRHRSARGAADLRADPADRWAEAIAPKALLNGPLPEANAM